MKFLHSLFPSRLKSIDKSEPLSTVHPVKANKSPAMQGVNAYWKELSETEIDRGRHRSWVGGYWDELGNLQYRFLEERGLLPQHKLLDIGCGSLRGGIHFIQYLNAGNYFGLDVNSSLIKAGQKELIAANILDKDPVLLVNDKFEFSNFGTSFDYALAFSVFTHLFLNHIGRCLLEVAQVLKPNGMFFATFFEAPTSVYIDRIEHELGGTTTNYDLDPFHYSVEEISVVANKVGLSAELVKDWIHPRGQKMLKFKHQSN